MVEVVQADRIAAVEIGRGEGWEWPEDAVLAGEFDTDPTVQGLAKHRLAHLTPNTDLSDKRARDLLVQPMDNAGAFNPREIVVSLDDALRAMQQYAAGLRGEVAVQRRATNAVLEALQAYLPPGGTDAKECINRILQAVDNPEVNLYMERG